MYQIHGPIARFAVLKQTPHLALDGALRYVPIAAARRREVHGERYRNRLYTSSVHAWETLQIRIGGDWDSSTTSAFSPLPGVVDELNSIF